MCNSVVISVVRTKNDGALRTLTFTCSGHKGFAKCRIGWVSINMTIEERNIDKTIPILQVEACGQYSLHNIMPSAEDLELDREVSEAVALVTSATTNPIIVSYLRRLYTQELTSHPLVHSLFCYPQWTNITHEQYLCILPALALASNLLSEAPTTNYIYALLRCPTKIRLDNRNRSYEEFTWLCTDPSQTLGPEAQKTYDAWLLALVPHLQLSTDARIEESSCAHTVPENLIFLAPGCDAVGVGSTMQISLHSIRALDPKRTNAKLLLLRWKHLATTIVHELLHAIMYAHRGMFMIEGSWQAKEKWFAADDYVEVGFSWEQAVMGGISNFVGTKRRRKEKEREEGRSRRKEELLLHDMDQSGTVELYRSGKTSFPVDIVREGQKGGVVGKIEPKEVLVELRDLIHKSMRKAGT